MSAPISSCWISKAALGDEEAYKAIERAMEYNMTSPAYSIMGCDCNPPCPEPTPEQLNRLNERLEAHLKDYAQRQKL